MLKLILSRGFVGMSAMICSYQAWGYIPLGDATAVVNSNAVWTSLIAFTFLKEKIHPLDIAAIPLTIVGIFFFAQPSFLFDGGAGYGDGAAIGLFFAVLSSILSASAFNIIRKIGKKVHFTVTVFYYSILGTLIIGSIMICTTGFRYPCFVSFILQ